MKATIIHIKSGVPKKYQEFYNKFIKFLQKEYPLKKDITILFLHDRMGHMTTGSDTDDHFIKVLTTKRLNRDILRTLAHEWSHEYQKSILKRKHTKDIGGKQEDTANAESGELIKKYEKDNPSDEPKMYNDNEKNRKQNQNTNRKDKGSK